MTSRQTERTSTSQRGRISRPKLADTTPARRRTQRRGDGEETISPEERLQLVSLGAYYRAEARGFAPGRELDDWLEAESEVEASLRPSYDSPDSV